MIFICGLFLTTEPSFTALDYQEQLIRVGISTTDFQALEYPSAQFTGDNNFVITDLSLEKNLINAIAGEVYKVTVSNKGFSIYCKGKTVVSNIEGPVGVYSPNGHIKLVDILRKGKTPAYRGRIEIVRASRSSNKLSVVNVLNLDDYLKAVVPNELPVSFGLEALKAQAVAARNYAIRPREKPYDQFDICDSVMCQVYFGYYTEHTLANKAVDETAGLVALHKGEVITALYSSAPGGYSENYEFAFSEPQTNQFPANPLPYLKGTSDDPSINDLSSDEAARKFYTTSPASFDSKSSYYRWSRIWTKPELEQVLNINLAKFSKDKGSSYFIRPVFRSGSCIGGLKDIKVLKRGVSGKAVELKIEGSNGSWTVQKELIIRRLLTKSGKALPSANIVIDLMKDVDGNISNIKLFGGGFGHGVGMSQYGASYMACNGYKFDQILQHYFNGIAIGTVPVILVVDESAIPVKQVFYSPGNTGILWIENEGVSSLKLKINDKDLLIEKALVDKSKVKLDISAYLNKNAHNEIVFYPPKYLENEEGLSVKMWVEVLKAR